MGATDPLTEPFAGLCSALRGMREQVQQLSHVHASLETFNSAFGDFQHAMALHASCLTFPKSAPTKKGSIQFSGIPAPQFSASALVRRSSRDSADSGSGSTGGGANSGRTTTSLGISNFGSSIGATANTKGTKRNSSSGATTNAKNTSKSNRSLSTNGNVSSSGYNPQLQPATTQVRAKASNKAGAANKRRAAPAKRPESPAWKWDKHVRDQIPRKYQSREELQKLENILLYIKNRRTGISIADLVKHSGLAVIKSKEILQTLMKLELIHREHEKSGFVYTFGSAP